MAELRSARYPTAFGLVKLSHVRRRNVIPAKIKVDVPGGVEFREDRTFVVYGFCGYSALNLDDLLKTNQSQF
jgi:hypothetical protein